MRAVRTALKNMRRGPYQAIVAILMMTLVFFMSMVLVLFLLFATQIIAYFESRPQVVAFFTASATTAQIQDVADAMQHKSYTDKVKVVSKEEALKIYKEDNKNDPVLLELVSADILPSSVEVSSKEIKSLPQIRDDLKSFAGVEDVIYQADVIDSLSRIITHVRIIGIVIISFLFVLSVTFLIVLLSLRIAQKKREIGIMRLLGASMGYVLWPYMVEGIIYAVWGAVFGWLAVFILYLYTLPQLVRFLGAIIKFPLPPLIFACLLLGGIVSGTLVGFLASLFAVRRFIRR